MQYIRNDAAVRAMKAGTMAIINKYEDFILDLIIIGPLFGLFFSPEVYFGSQDPDSFTVSTAMANKGYPVTSAINHLTTLFLFYLVWRHWRGYARNLRYSTLLLLEFAAFVASTSWSPDKFISLRTSYHLLLYIIIATHVTYRYTAAEFIGKLTTLCTISGVLCLLSIALIPHFSHSVGLTGYESAYRGLYLTKNYLGDVTAIAIGLAAYSFLIGANSKLNIFLCIVTNLLCLVLSQSATSGITVGIELVFVGIIYGLRNNVGRVVLVVVTVGAVLLVMAALSTVSDPFQLIGRSSTLTGRTEIWGAVIPLVVANPVLGYGLGFWQFDFLPKNNVWLQLDWAAPHAHNDTLDLLLQVGAVGFFFVCLNMFGSIGLCLKRIRNVQDGTLMCLLFMLTFIINGLTEALTLTDGSRSAFILFCFQIYAWKLAFAPKTLWVTPGQPVVAAPPHAVAAE